MSTGDSERKKAEQKSGDTRISSAFSQPAFPIVGGEDVTVAEAAAAGAVGLYIDTVGPEASHHIFFNLLCSHGDSASLRAQIIIGRSKIYSLPAR